MSDTRNCSTCAYCRESFINVQTLQKQLICFYYPPKTTTLNVNNQVVTGVSHPVVQENDFCAFFRNEKQRIYGNDEPIIKQ